MNIKSIKLSDTLVFMLTFILFTVIGTLSHEYGHIAVAEYCGFSTRLSSASMDYNTDLMYNKLDSISKIYKYEIQNKTDFPMRKMYQDLHNDLTYGPLYISIGGPAQTMLVGIIGLIFLLLRRRTIALNGVKFIDWTALFFLAFLVKGSI